MDKVTVYMSGIMAVAAVSVTGALYYPPVAFYSQRAIVSNTLRDPDSAVFKDDQSGSNGAYCARVNGNNAYGAKTGFRRVIIDESGVVLIEGETPACGRADCQDSDVMDYGTSVSIEALRKELQQPRSDPYSKAGEAFKEWAQLKVFNDTWREHCVPKPGA